VSDTPAASAPSVCPQTFSAPPNATFPLSKNAGQGKRKSGLPILIWGKKLMTGMNDPQGSKEWFHKGIVL